MKWFDERNEALHTASFVFYTHTSNVFLRHTGTLKLHELKFFVTAFKRRSSRSEEESANSATKTIALNFPCSKCENDVWFLDSSCDGYCFLLRRQTLRVWCLTTTVGPSMNSSRKPRPQLRTQKRPSKRSPRLELQTSSSWSGHGLVFNTDIKNHPVVSYFLLPKLSQKNALPLGQCQYQFRLEDAVSKCQFTNAIKNCVPKTKNDSQYPIQNAEPLEIPTSIWAIQSKYQPLHTKYCQVFISFLLNQYLATVLLFSRC